MTDGSVEKVVHAGEQDFAALYEKGEIVPKNVFDSQVAAALVGYGDQISYAKLVAKITGVQLEKLETLTDWTARPLTKAQIDYSLEDVRYLAEIRKHLGERLEALGRSGWELEEVPFDSSWLDDRVVCPAAAAIERATTSKASSLPSACSSTSCWSDRATSRRWAFR